jgi:hypothetical protein
MLVLLIEGIYEVYAVELASCGITTISVVLVRKRTIPIERSPPVSEASANFCG